MPLNFKLQYDPLRPKWYGYLTIIMKQKRLLLHLKTQLAFPPSHGRTSFNTRRGTYRDGNT